ncbi:glycosyltransferase [Chitinophaga vietnamensis]|uniref:glycosyltransferase n=1 Tax=Chitinophaga vietnamensis TaxID=2593957 RepID=UPI0011774092|nr:glycosyltransferase family A protein [Chitinophaga vietnamensis]
MQYSISFCTVCMNRAMHLKETLLQNIIDNLDYHPVEFVLLDYGSRDDMYDWARQTLQSYVNKGLLRYYRNPEPQFFHMSHAKNMALRLASNEIVCSVDADNFTGRGFAAYINERFSRESDIFLSPPRIGIDKKWWDVQGRICLRKDDFYTLRGYDEGVVEYGYEDQDFKNRLEVFGRRKVVIKDPAFLQALQHDDSLRIAEGCSTKKMKELFISIADDTSEIIYLQNNNSYERFYTDNDLLIQEGNRPMKISLRNMYTGIYAGDGRSLQLYKRNNEPLMILSIQSDGSLRSKDQREFYPITSRQLCESFLMQRAIYLGRKVYISNRNRATAVNGVGFGTGTVWRNFSDERIILD